MEHETFWTLLHDLAHWEFELFLIFIFDILIGVIIWPFFKKRIYDNNPHHKSDDAKIARLEKENRAMKRILLISDEDIEREIQEEGQHGKSCKH